MNIIMPNGKYQQIEIDQSEKDVVILWQVGKEESNCIIIEREQIEVLIKLSKMKPISDDMKIVKLSGMLSSLFPEEKYEGMKDKVMGLVQEELERIKTK